jgi:preprotein translocase subunit SecF
MNLVAKRRWFYGLSLVLIVPGVVSLLLFGLRLGIDFTGGVTLEEQGNTNQAQVASLAQKQGFQDVTVTTSGPGRLLLQYRDSSSASKQEANHKAFDAKLQAVGATEIQYDQIGPSISHDLTQNALLSIFIASLAIVGYIAFAFRNAPPPVSPLSFGVTAIIALIHDALFVIGAFSIFGKLFGTEVDTLFVTAVLTIIGFSVHDTIVVFDRIRENLRRERKSFAEVVNDSILETFARSINTSLTVLLTLLALFLFGGQSIHTFVLALLLGIASGTYSSIFNASQLLVTWHEFKLKRIEADASKTK